MPGEDAQVDTYVEAHLGAWIAELARLCAQPSVSARHEGIDDCAALVAEVLGARGFTVEVMPTEGGHPVVVGQHDGAEQSRTLLCYNHYDVQPPEPLELWTTPPFQPTIRDGSLYARGAKDDKGDFMARVAALDALHAVYGAYPCRVTFFVEGEEEIGSPHLAAWFETHRARLHADAAIWEEGGIDADGRVVLALGARGLLYVELSVETLGRDAHSGQANLLPNAAWRLIWAIASLKGPDERITIPGFADAVREPTARQEELLAELPSQEESMKQVFGVDRLLLGRTGPEVTRAVFAPTCNVAGIGSGYQGPGAKTIVPAVASAKIDFRLVPDQDPDEVMHLLRRHLDDRGFADVRVERLGGYRPGITDPDAPFVQLAVAAAAEVYGQPARLVPLVGGTTPMYLFTDQGVPVTAPGVGYHANGAHGPNEHVRLHDFSRAVRHLARLIQRFGVGAAP